MPSIKSKKPEKKPKLKPKKLSVMLPNGPSASSSALALAILSIKPGPNAASKKNASAANAWNTCAKNAAWNTNAKKKKTEWIEPIA